MIPIIKTVLRGDNAAQYIHFAQTQLGILERQMSFQKLNEGRRVVSPFPGVLVECSSKFGNRVVRVSVVPKVIGTLIDTPQKEKIQRKSITKTKKDFDIIALAYKWNWNTRAVFDANVIDQFNIETVSTTVASEQFVLGNINDPDDVVLGGTSNFSFDLPIDNGEKPYRVTDFSQVRYANVGGGSTSLIMFDYCVSTFNIPDYIYVNVLGEGNPSMKLMFYTYIPYGTYPFLSGVNVCKWYIDAALSTDLKTLYVVKSARNLVDYPYKAHVIYSTYVISEETGLWVLDITGNFDATGATGGTFVYGALCVDRDGNIGMFSMVNPTPEVVSVSNTSTYMEEYTSSLCDKYVFSIPTQSFVVSENVSYGGKVIDLSTFDYEMIKVSPKTTTSQKTTSYYTYIGYASQTFTGIATSHANSTLGSAYSFPYLGDVAINGEVSGSYVYTGTGTMTSTGTYSDTNVKDVIGAATIPMAFSFAGRRTIISTIGQGLRQIENFTYQETLGGSGTFNTVDCYGSCTYGWCDTMYYGVTATSGRGSSPVNLMMGCRPIDEFEIVGSGYFITNDTTVDVTSYSYKAFMPAAILYPPIIPEMAPSKIKNAFISCDQVSQKAFYGLHMQSTDQAYNDSGYQVAVSPLGGTPPTIEPKSVWIVSYYNKATDVTKDVTQIISNEYGTTLLADTTNDTCPPDAPIDYDAYPVYTPPWMQIPATYTHLESFFGIMFYADTIKN